MFRKLLMHQQAGKPTALTWRGTDVSRMEGFSDGVFGFALTLLVVSLDIPDTYDQLAAAMRNTPSFAVCFMLLIAVWYGHYQFFRRYGLEDPPTLAINAMLLFVVLVYIYPLKFLFTELTDLLLGINTTVTLADGTRGPSITDAQWPGLMMIYAAGYIACFGCFLLLYLRAWWLRATLALTPSELLETRASILGQLSNVGAGLISFAFAAGGSAALAGLSFALQWPFGWVIDRIIDRQRQALAQQTQPVESGQDTAAGGGAGG